MASGPRPTVIGRPGSSVAVPIGVMVPPPEFATYTVLPSAAMAAGPAEVTLTGVDAVAAPARTCTGARPALIGLPAVLPAARIGVTGQRTAGCYGRAGIRPDR
jgi:hypothetical protein